MDAPKQSDIDSPSKPRSITLPKRGIDSFTANSVNIKHNFHTTDMVLPSSMSTEASGPPSPQAGPPVNFGTVAPGIYRSSFPQDSNIDFLESLNLKTIITLVETEPSEAFQNLITRKQIQHYTIPIPAHKGSTDKIPEKRVAQVMKILLDESNGPVLIHCNKGKHRTGCMVATFRSIQRLHNPTWGLDKILTEYHRYADPKPRAYDEAYISGIVPERVMATIPNLVDSTSSIGKTEPAARPFAAGIPKPLVVVKKNGDYLNAEEQAALHEQYNPSGPNPEELTARLKSLKVAQKYGLDKR